jgi:hypothetical protein
VTPGVAAAAAQRARSAFDSPARKGRMIGFTACPEASTRCGGGGRQPAAAG